MINRTNFAVCGSKVILLGRSEPTSFIAAEANSEPSIPANKISSAHTVFRFIFMA
jgi:hypothetical protein